MRLFVGVRPSTAFRTALGEMQERLRAAGVTGLYLEPGNLHMTLAFIGEWRDPDSVPLLEVRRPFSVRLSHPDVFPKARVLWAGTEPSEELEWLAAEVRGRLAEAGIPFDPKPFVPHITLARKPVLPTGGAVPEIPVPEAAMTVEEVCLFRSERGEQGMEYTVIRGGRKQQDRYDEGRIHFVE